MCPTPIRARWWRSAISTACIGAIKRLIGEARRMAEERGAPLGVLAFEPHPQEFFRPPTESFRLTPFRTKARLIAELGADVMFALPSMRRWRPSSAQEFVLDVLVEGLGVGAIVVGEDFQFGKGRAGNITVAHLYGRAWKVSASTVFEPVAAEGHEKISSTRIREALKAGKPEEAARSARPLVDRRGACRAWRQARPHHRLSHREHADRRLPAPGLRRLCRAGHRDRGRQVGCAP